MAEKARQMAIFRTFSLDGTACLVYLYGQTTLDRLFKEQPKHGWIPTPQWPAGLSARALK
jgi:hypothetical protein